MRITSESKLTNQAASTRKLSPELNEFMHLLAMLDSQFAQQSGSQTPR
jgi:hypothetical protein